ncbi:MAG TPA: NUDIX domain-containing protein [Candidatus Microsaccharimonas sp.]|nr:NUDIX domain-containing protein [Candidatus Microsaccharimonas sp.]
MAKEKLFHVGVKALITNRAGQILIFETDTSKFLTPEQSHADLPGGRIDIGEDPLAALKREMVEETGITDFDGAELFTSVISPIQIPISQTERVGLALMVYRVTVPEGSTVTLSDEHTGYEWVSAREAARRLTYKFGQEFADTLLQAHA